MSQFGQVVQYAGEALAGGVALVAALTAVRSGPEFYGVLALTAGRRLGPWRAGSSDDRVPLPGGSGEPAHASYWWSQAWVDAGTALRAGTVACWDRLTDDWLAERAWRLMLGQARDRRPYDNWFGRKLARLAGAGIALGAVLGAALAALVSLVMALLFGLLLGVAWLGLGGFARVLYSLELAGPRVRGVRLRCPYPGCWEPIGLPVHQCSFCGREHRALRPGRYGVLRRVCQCGKRLPTSALLHRGRLTASCPHCSRVLPDGLGTVRLVHLPLIGADSAGKTMFLMAAVAGLRSAAAAGIELDFATDADRDRHDRAEQQLRTGDWVNATTEPLPQAFMLRLRRGRRRRLLYLYDPMGESVRQTDSLREQRYLAHADGLLLVCDLLAEPEVFRKLTVTDRQAASAARPALEELSETYARVRNELGPMSGRRRRRRTPVALVVTKRDVLEGLSALAPLPSGEVADWLKGIGLGNLVESLKHDFGGSRGWAVSARAATVTGADPGELRRVAEPLLWLLAGTGLRLPKGVNRSVSYRG